MTRVPVIAEAPPPNAPPLTLSGVWRYAIWFAAAAALTQLALTLVLDTVTTRMIVSDADAIWMVSVADAGTFVAAALLITAVVARWPGRWADWLALAAFLFLFLVGPAVMIPRISRYATLALAAGAAVRMAQWIEARRASIDRLVQRTWLPLVAILIVMSAGGQASRWLTERRADRSEPPAPAGAPNVLLIVLDTVRASALGFHGYNRPTSPNLDRFVSGGTVFEQAMSTSPWTLPAHASLFTGRMPHEVSADWLTPLNHDPATLAEVLGRHGYVTAGFVANLLYTVRGTGLARGFARYEDVPATPAAVVRASWQSRWLFGRFVRKQVSWGSLVRKDASQVNAEVRSWLSRPRSRPFFVFLNYFDTHSPYLPPPPFDRKFGAGGGDVPDVTSRRDWSPEQIQRTRDAYDGSLAYLDDQVGQLLASLSADHLLDNTLVVLMSDHGEQFGEHGLFDHANSLYRQALHVPLVFALPGHVPSGARIKTPVSLVDVGATILDLLAIDPQTSGFPGRSLAEHWRDPSAPVPARPLLAEVSKGVNTAAWLPITKGPMQSVFVGFTHYIRHSDGREELYATEHDAEETEDLSARPDAAALLAESRRALEGLTAGLAARR